MDIRKEIQKYFPEAKAMIWAASKDEILKWMNVLIDMKYEFIFLIRDDWYYILVDADEKGVKKLENDFGSRNIVDI